MSRLKTIAIVAWLAPASVMAAGTRLDYARAPGAESCPAAAVVRASVATRLGFDPFSDAGSRVLHCQIAPDGGGLRAQIDVEDEQGRAAGQRVLTSKRADCADLAPALLLVMSLAARQSAGDVPGGPRAVRADERVDVQPIAGGAASESSAAARRPVPNRALAEDEPAAAARRRASRRATEAQRDVAVATAAPASPREPLFDAVSVGAGALGALGALPHPSLGATASVGVARGRASLAMELRFDAPTTLATPAGEARLWAATGWLVPCARRSWLAGCALVGAGLQHGTGVGVVDARSGSSAWFGAGLRAAFRAALWERTALVFHADLLFVPSRIATRLGQPPVEIWRTPLVSGALGVGVIHDFR